MKPNNTLDTIYERGKKVKGNEDF